MGIKVAHLPEGQSDAGAALAAQLGSPAVVVYFASPKYAPEALAAAVAGAFPSATTFGCTSSGELVSGAMTKCAVVAMGFDADVVSRAEVALVSGIKDSVDGIDKAFADWEGRVGQKMLDLDPERWIGLVLVDGLSGAEERVMDRIGNLTNVNFIGGSAGDDVAFKKTFVAAAGHAPTDLTSSRPRASTPAGTSLFPQRWTRRLARSSSSTASRRSQPMQRPWA